MGLAASIDPITPWIETLQAMRRQRRRTVPPWASDPFPIIQQVVANQFTYLSELPDIEGLILSQVVGNIGNAIRAPFAVDTSTLNEEHDSIWTLLPALVTIPRICSPSSTSPPPSLPARCSASPARCSHRSSTRGQPEQHRLAGLVSGVLERR